MSMEDSFRVRVDKVFGALGALGSGGNPTSVGLTPALWSLTDEEIQRRKWNRSKELSQEDEHRHQSTSSPLLHPDLESDINDLSDKEEEGEEEDEDEEDSEEIDGAKRRQNNSGGGGESNIDEYLDVQSNIGRDCTLDFEEEEDEYDKVAVGAKEIDDRVYLRNVNHADYQIDDVTGFSELPSSLKVAEKDPRANHSAAKIRLREDAEAAGELDALQLSESSMITNLDSEDYKKGELDTDNPKSILKKRENSMDTKTQKRVRFMVDPECSSTHEDQQTSGASDLASEPHARGDDSLSEQTSDLSKYYAGVPDYVRNPSKYTRYTFDSSDEMDEEANQKAYMDFFHDLRKRNTDTLMEETPVELPKSIVFTPKKKPENDSSAKSDSELKARENLENTRWSVDITAKDIQENEISAMEEDERTIAVDEGGRSSRKSGRQYRRKTNLDDGDQT